MVIQVVTLFPEMFDGVFNTSILKRAQNQGKAQLRTVPMRPFGVGRHHAADDYPFGGGVGMVLRVDVVVEAVEWAMMHEKAQPTVIFTSAQGERFTQSVAQELAQVPHLILVAGHYEGIDERAREITGAREISIGDYVLTGGELASMVMVDAVVRLLPGVLGSHVGAEQDSFSGAEGWLEGPQYTRPELYRGAEVPSVLLSGHHQKIGEWQRNQSYQRTLERRPDIFGTSHGDLTRKGVDSDGLH